MSTPTQENQPSVPEQKQEKELNFERLRKQLEQERSARMQAEEKAKQLEQERTQQPKKDPQAYEEEEESNEPYVDHKHLNRKFARFEQNFEKKVDQLAEQKARALLEQEKQQTYVKQNPDFTNVLTQENIQKFADQHPAIAERMLRMPDNFDRQALLYEQIKALGAKKEEPKQSIQGKIEQNRRGAFYQPSGIPNAPYAMTGDFSPSGQKNAYEKLQQLKSNMRLGG